MMDEQEVANIVGEALISGKLLVTSVNCSDYTIELSILGDNVDLFTRIAPTK